MTVSVRPWDQIAADLRASLGWSKVGPEAAVAGDALAAELERIEAALPICPTCGGSGKLRGNDTGNVYVCPDCDHGKVTVAQLAATWQAVHGDWATFTKQNRADLLVYLRAVRP